MAKVPVAADAAAKPYYKYYEMDIKSPTPEQMAYIAQSKGGVSQALEIADRNELLKKCVPEKTGYYPLKAGGILVAGNIDMPEVTPEMLYWWFAWHGLEPLRYAIWDPEDHFDVQLDAEGRSRALDESIPLTEKTWGATHTVLESIGGPADEIVIMFQNPNKMGMNMELFGTPACRFMVIANALLGPMKVPVVMLETASERPEGGLTFHARFWVGYHIIGGEGKYLLPPEVQVPEEVMMGLIAHNIKEFTHLGEILPSVYKEEGMKKIN